MTGLKQAIRSTPAHVGAGMLVGGLATLLTGLPLVVVLGTLGGSWGEAVLGGIGVPIGIALTLLVLATILLALGGTAGGSVAWVLGRLVRNLRSHLQDE